MSTAATAEVARTTQLLSPVPKAIISHEGQQHEAARRVVLWLGRISAKRRYEEGLPSFRTDILQFGQSVQDWCHKNGLNPDEVVVLCDADLSTEWQISDSENQPRWAYGCRAICQVSTTLRNEVKDTRIADCAQRLVKALIDTP